MKLSYKFFIFVFLINLIIILLSIKLIEEHKILFLAVELLILIFIGVSIHLYKAFIRPLHLIATGIESIKDKDFNTKFVRVGQVEMDQLIEVYNHMIDQLREERIKQQEQHYFLDLLIKASPSGIIVLDFEDKISSINQAAEKLLNTGGTQIPGKSLADIEGNFAAELNRLEADESKIINLDGLHSFKCQKAHFSDRGFKHHFILIEELTAEILKVEKRAFEKVIRMMSHETNNSIGAINSILNSFLTYKNQLTNEDREDFENALMVAVNRNLRLNSFMSNFTDVVRIPPPNRQSCDLHELLKTVQILMNAECERNNISWRWELAETPFIIQLDIQQMEQVLVNAIKNSIEAIGNDGQISVKTMLAPSHKLIIQDTGKGIADNIQSQIFTPFFSTKKNGQGIGLTIIREILINHSFRFSLESTDKNYTEFTVEFR
ncbi:MAG: HAMP domain-containing protein [candidate division Zixibacteria bacterium]|nr:HAMP domain-containing protein [candidate division Zixibacteria bacterium]